jgi:hypothetical protein
MDDDLHDIRGVLAEMDTGISFRRHRTIRRISTSIRAVTARA